jgi:hypothetical protein
LLTKKGKKSDFVEIVPVKDKLLSRSELCDDNVVKKETGYFLHCLSNNIRNMSRKYSIVKYSNADSGVIFKFLQNPPIIKAGGTES